MKYPQIRRDYPNALRVLIIIFFTCTLESCSNKNKVEPHNPASSNLSSASRNKDFTLDISYDNVGNPVLIKSTGESYKGSVKIIYEGEKIKSMVSENQHFNRSPEIFNFEVKYINDYEVHISTFSEVSIYTKLVFNAKGLLEKVTETINDSWGKREYTNDYLYNSDNNLVLLKDADSSTQFESYEDYDNMNNPFYAKAKIWTIINSVHTIHFRTYMPFPISKNNPRILTLRDYNAGNKLVYKYDKNNFPIEIQEYVYKKGTPGPPKESDYFLEEEIIKLSY